MAFCSNCGKPLSDDAKFCTECGAKVEAAGGGPSKIKPEVVPAPAAPEERGHGTPQPAPSYPEEPGHGTPQPAHRPSPASRKQKPGTVQRTEPANGKGKNLLPFLLIPAALIAAVFGVMIMRGGKKTGPAAVPAETRTAAAVTTKSGVSDDAKKVEEFLLGKTQEETEAGSGAQAPSSGAEETAADEPEAGSGAQAPSSGAEETAADESEAIPGTDGSTEETEGSYRFEVPSRWYGWMRISDVRGSDLEARFFDVYGYLDQDEDGQAYMEVYDLADQEESILSMYVSTNKNRLLPMIGQDDGWLLDTYLVPSEARNLTMTASDDGGLKFRTKYERYDGSASGTVELFMREDGSEWDERKDELPPGYDVYVSMFDVPVPVEGESTPFTETPGQEGILAPEVSDVRAVIMSALAAPGERDLALIWIDPPAEAYVNVDPKLGEFGHGALNTVLVTALRDNTEIRVCTGEPIYEDFGGTAEPFLDGWNTKEEVLMHRLNAGEQYAFAVTVPEGMPGVCLMVYTGESSAMWPITEPEEQAIDGRDYFILQQEQQ